MPKRRLKARLPGRARRSWLLWTASQAVCRRWRIPGRTLTGSRLRLPRLPQQRNRPLQGRRSAVLVLSDRRHPSRRARSSDDGASDTRVREGVVDGPLRQDLSPPSLPSSPPETADSRQSSPPESAVSESRFRRAGKRRKAQETAGNRRNRRNYLIGAPAGSTQETAGNRRKPPEAEIGRPFRKQISADSALDRGFAGPPAPKGFTRRGDHAWRTGGLG